MTLTSYCSCRLCLCSRRVLTGLRLQAIRVMRDQSSGGHIFNMDGAGADGGATPRFAAYGASKRGLAQLGKSLQVQPGVVHSNSTDVKLPCQTAQQPRHCCNQPEYLLKGSKTDSADKPKYHAKLLLDRSSRMD